jgi:hypothetical protein
MAAFASPYIKTEAAQVTRLADSAVMTGVNFSSWFNPEQGCIVAEFSLKGFAGAFSSPYAISDSTALGSVAQNRIQAYQNASFTSMGADVRTNSAAQAAIVTASSNMNTGYIKHSISYAFNDIKASADGGAVGTDTVAVLPVLTQLVLGRSNEAATATAPAACYIRRLTYYPQALTAANLQAVTR